MNTRGREKIDTRRNSIRRSTASTWRGSLTRVVRSSTLVRKGMVSHPLFCLRDSYNTSVQLIVFAFARRYPILESARQQLLEVFLGSQETVRHALQPLGYCSYREAELFLSLSVDFSQSRFSRNVSSRRYVPIRSDRRYDSIVGFESCQSTGASKPPSSPRPSTARS